MERFKGFTFALLAIIALFCLAGCGCLPNALTLRSPVGLAQEQRAVLPPANQVVVSAAPVYAQTQAYAVQMAPGFAPAAPAACAPQYAPPPPPGMRQLDK